MKGTPYQPQIETILSQTMRAGLYDPRHIEAFMRLEHSTLDHLSASRFRQEVNIAILCIDEGGPDVAERVAQSFGF